jgi:hypothetical protein
MVVIHYDVSKSTARLATYSSICPLCNIFIAKNHSPIEILDEKITPRGDNRYSYDSGEYYHSSGEPAKGAWTPKRVVHERCYWRYMERVTEGRELEPLWRDRMRGEPIWDPRDPVEWCVWMSKLHEWWR